MVLAFCLFIPRKQPRKPHYCELPLLVGCLQLLRAIGVVQPFGSSLCIHFISIIVRYSCKSLSNIFISDHDPTGSLQISSTILKLSRYCQVEVDAANRDNMCQAPSKLKMVHKTGSYASNRIREPPRPKTSWCLVIHWRLPFRSLLP